MADTSQQHRATVVVMAKRASAGRVKTRLIGALSGERAAGVHEAMLACVLERAAGWIGEGLGRRCIIRGRGQRGNIRAGAGGLQRVLALTDTEQGSAAGLSGVPGGWQVMDQGSGSLGDRMMRVWSRVYAQAAGPVVFLGTDSPDVPAALLRSILPALDGHDATVGPADDGGYWTLAAVQPQQCLLKGIDWGSDRVYHQTHQAARQAGVDLVALGAWPDVDTLDDLRALRARLRQCPGDEPEPAIVRLAQRLDDICGNLQP